MRNEVQRWKDGESDRESNMWGKGYSFTFLPYGREVKVNWESWREAGARINPHVGSDSIFMRWFHPHGNGSIRIGREANAIFNPPLNNNFHENDSILFTQFFFFIRVYKFLLAMQSGLHPD